ncbi:MAG TPA: UDP-3-O-(3-hydroxymyristoyl)glucosamine N-acyltransferase, partial [Proteobacteria bacterium]|nr:UDP-3-O-(3-hydroxymyristoyl)glucosamine N-acyltransferase [Pseudomonadota bacterium]
DCIIGDRVRLHFGVSIGADGFGYAEMDGRHHKIPQVGAVVVGDDVEIGANSCIDRATMGNTVIGDGTKIDNLVQIGHNCRVGKNCILVAHAGLGGSTVLGDGVVVAARAGTKDHISVGDRSMIGAMAGVGYDLPPGSKVIGYPAEDHLSWKRKLVYLSKLGDLFSRVKALEKRLERMENSRGKGDE